MHIETWSDFALLTMANLIGMAIFHGIKALVKYYFRIRR